MCDYNVPHCQNSMVGLSSPRGETDSGNVLTMDYLCQFLI